MSANVSLAVIQSAYAAFGIGDIPALSTLLSEDVVWEFVGDSRAPYTGRASGKQAVAEWFGSVAAADGIQVFEPREFFAGSDHVSVIGWERTTALATGTVFECPWAHVWTLCDGLITRLFGILDTEAAAAARSSVCLGKV